MPRFKKYKYGEWAIVSHQRAAAHRPHIVAVDTETSGFGWWDEAFCVTMTWPARAEGGLYSAYFDLEADESGTRRHIVKQILKATPTWVFHNAKFDLQKLEMAGCLPDNWRDNTTIEDTATMAALIDENRRKGLKYLGQVLLGDTTNEEKVLAKVRRKLKIKKDDGYHLIPREFVVPYALKDTELTLRLFQYLRTRLPEDMQQLYRDEIELELCLLPIEGHGIGLDIPYLSRTTSEHGVLLMKLDGKLKELTGNDTFNSNSPKQILEAFAMRGVTLLKTDKEALGERPDDELAQTILEYRRIKKLYSTYLVGMLDEQRDGVIHPNFNLTTPRTGRMSSGAATNN